MKIICLLVFFLALVTFGLFTSCESAESEDANKLSKGEEAVSDDKMTIDALKILRSTKIKAYGEWDVGENLPLTFVVIEADGEDTLMVYDQVDSVIYSKEVVSIERIYTVSSLRKIHPQLVFEYSEGGNDSYIQMIDIDQKRVIEKVDTANGANEFGADIQIQPQFHSGTIPSKEPFEIILSEFGLPSPAGNLSKVLRYDGIKYRVVGKFERNEGADCIESLLKK